MGQACSIVVGSGNVLSRQEWLLENETILMKPIIFLSITVNLQTWDNAMHTHADCRIKYNEYLGT